MNTGKQFLGHFKTIKAGGVFFWKACIFFGVDTPEVPPTPQTPPPVPWPDKKGYQFAPFWILHPSAYSSTACSIDPKIRNTPSHLYRTMCVSASFLETYDVYRRETPTIWSWGKDVKPRIWVPGSLPAKNDQGHFEAFMGPSRAKI